MRTLFLAIVAFALAPGQAPSADKDKQPAKEDKQPAKEKEKLPAHVIQLMQDKLKHSQKLLEGLATAEFNRITESAEELMRISKQAEFAVLKTKDYELHSNAFRRGLETVIQKAKEKNVDGAALGYVDITLTCVRCHQYTRDQRLTNAPGPLTDAALARLGR
jgi:hypothetical protein